MRAEMHPPFEIHATPGAEARPGPRRDCWRLEIPPGPQRSYRLAQLDDTTSRARNSFSWTPPLTLSLRARVSAPEIPGTWGFGLWNDPFSLSLGFGGGARRLPALPNAAWFFYASSHNYLSLRDDLPARGFLAQAFRSSNLPAPLLALASPALPLLAWPRLARQLRALLRRLICEDSFALAPDVTQWQRYSLEWRVDRVVFQAGDQTFESGITPRSRLGLVIWVDNQYLAWPPTGKLSYGVLANPVSAWLEVDELSVAVSRAAEGLCYNPAHAQP